MVGNIEVRQEDVGANTKHIALDGVDDNRTRFRCGICVGS